jgi:hypothetical protein
MAHKPSYQHTLIWSSPRVEQYDEGEADDTRRLEIDSAKEVKLNALP